MDINSFKKEGKRERKLDKPTITMTPTEEFKDAEDTGILTKENEELSLDKTSNIFNSDETNLTEEDILKYLEYFETLGITKTKVFEILDSILTSGQINWNFNLLNKIPVVFRLRPSWVNDELLKILDESTPRTLVGYTEIISKFNLAGSLKIYNNISIDIKKKEDLENALNFIGELPYIVRAHLIKQLAVFDRVVAIATSDWALENFTLPQQEK